ncbi:MAG: glycosyltransferase family 4 protein [Patescibacteria group bacterium]
MKIIVFAGYFFPHKGGYENYIFELYKRLAIKGISVDVITCNTNNSLKEEKINGINIYRLDCWNILGGTYPIPKLNRNFFYIYRKIKKRNYNFVNTHTRFFLTSLLGFIFAKLNNIDLIHTEHGTKHTVLTNPIINLISHIYDHTLGYLVIKFSEYNLSVSRASGEFSKHLGAKEYKIVWNGIDSHIFHRRQTNIKTQLKISGNNKIITFVGRLIEAKGVQDLIEVYYYLSHKYKITLLIIGKGNFEYKLKEKAKDFKDIIFLGEITKEEIVDILSVTDIFINPSYSEGLPTSVLEAGACSCPVVATDVGGTNEIIENGKNGYLFCPHNLKDLQQKIDTLLNKRDTAAFFGDQLRKKIVSKFDWSVIQKQFFNVIKNAKL